MKLHCVLEDSDKIYVVTDDVKGPNLFSHIIRNNRLNETHTATIAA